MQISNPPWPQVSRYLGSARLSTVLFAGFLVVVCAVTPTPALGQQVPESCAQNNGTWLKKYKECEYTSREWCDRAGGHFDECGSACRHEVNPGPCTMQCVPVCKFATYLVGKDASASDHERMFGVIPTHAITNDKNAPPLTPRGKFRVFLDNTTDPFILIGTGLQAGVSQATDEFHGYGQGASGYGKRLGASMADFSIGEFMGTFVFPSLLHEDPRYFREGSGSGGKRLVYALSSAVIVRKDSGRRGFGWANILGRITAGAISNAYYPQEDRGVGLVFSRTAIGIGFGTAGAVFSEFGPDIQRKLFGDKKPRQPDAEKK